MTVGRNNSDGFTLMELILVMVLISVTLAMAAPSLRGFAASRQTADLAARLVAMTQWARSQAVAQGQVCRLSVEPGGRACRLSVQKAGAFVEPDGDWAKALIMPEGANVSLQTDAVAPVVTAAGILGAAAQQAPVDDYIQFYPTGRCDLGEFTVTAANGEAFVVVCDAPTEPYHVLSGQEAANR